MSKKKFPTPARILFKSSPHRNTGGTHVDELTQSVVEYESPNERHAANMLLLCSDVISIASQPTTDSYLFDGKPRDYTPDFIVDTFVSDLRIEVKSLVHLADSSSAQEKYRAIATAYRERNIPFAFLVDAQLEQEPLFSNVEILKRYIKNRLPLGTLARTQDALSEGPLAAPDLQRRADVQWVDVLTLIAQRHICFDWGTALHPKTTVVSLPEQPFGGLYLEHILRSTRYGRLLEEMALGRRPSDQRLLEDAQTWRWGNRPLDPGAIVGGFKEEKPLRALGEGESLLRDPQRRQDFAPGRPVDPRDAN